MKAAIFDMDGVIFDTERIAYESWLKTAETYGFAPIDEPYMKCIGTTKEITREIFMEHYGPTFDYEFYKQKSVEYIRTNYPVSEIPLKKGVKELLAYLKKEGYFVAIASSTVTQRVEELVEGTGIRSFFDRIVGGDQIQHSKPDPEIFIKAADGIDTARENIFVFEDSYNGIRAANRAGMFPIMIPDLVEPNDEMCNLASKILPDLLAVRDFLANNNKEQ